MKTLNRILELGMKISAAAMIIIALELLRRSLMG